MVMINIIQFINTLKTDNVMNSKEFDKDYNTITIIDDLIMELSLAKIGNNPSVEKLQQGVDLLEQLISQLDEQSLEFQKGKLGIIPVNYEDLASTNKYKSYENKDDLELCTQFLKKLIRIPKIVDENEIEKFQDQLLKISLPIWRKQVIELKYSKFKQLEL